MKRFLIWFLVLLMVPFGVLVAASETDNDTAYVVNLENRTISDGQYTYHYTITSDSGCTKVTFTYPDGGTYFVEKRNGNAFGYGGYNAELYTDGDVLWDILEQHLAANQITLTDKGKLTFEKLLAAFVLWGVGALQLAAPGFFAMLKVIWWVRDAEPSDFAIVMTRISGAICILVGIFILFF